MSDVRKKDYFKIHHDPCIRNPARPGKTGVKAWPESRGEPGHKPGFGQAGQGIKKTGEAGATGPARPGQTRETGVKAWPESQPLARLAKGYKHA